MTAFLYLTVWLALVPIIAYWRAFVAVVLWGWFVTPAFGVAAPSIHHAFGIMLLLVFLLPPASDDDKTQRDLEGRNLADLVARMLGRAVLYPALMLGVGWLWKWLSLGL